MIEKLLKFQHENSNIPCAIGFSEEMDNKCREIIQFSTFTNYFIKNDFFDGNDDVPANLTTVTGVLEKCINLCINDDERLYTIFIFKQVHEHAANALGAYKMYTEEGDKEKKKLDILMQLVELKALTGDEDRSNFVTPKDMFARIEAAKDNMYNFEKYYNSIHESQD